MTWIKVEDGLPKSEGFFLVYCETEKKLIANTSIPKREDRIRGAFFQPRNSGKKWFPDHRFFDGLDFVVSHWRPLPEKP